VKALLHYCHYSNEFVQDTMGVEVARVSTQYTVVMAAMAVLLSPMQQPLLMRL